MKYVFLALPLVIIACSKEAAQNDKIVPIKSEQSVTTVRSTITTTEPITTFTKYTIKAGAHYSDQNFLKAVSGSSMSFVAKFDNSAIYSAVITDYNHAYDINKLYGFSEGFNNQYNSARIGWRWLNGELQLFAYVYINGKLLRDPISYDPPFIKSVTIGKEINCRIAVSGSTYVFTVDGVVVTTRRGLSTASFKGYQQYPYFGGTLTAPHLMNFYLK